MPNRNRVSEFELEGKFYAQMEDGTEMYQGCIPSIMPMEVNLRGFGLTRHL